jgi:hypothetical protein
MLARRTVSPAARSLFVWFVSPRLATRTALRLAFKQLKMVRK